MDKQINLYAYVSAQAQRYKKKMIIVWGTSVALVVALALSYAQLHRERMTLQSEIATASSAGAVETSTLEKLKKELSMKKNQAEANKKDDSGSDDMRLSSEVAASRLLSMSWDVFKSWSSPGAALRRVSYDSGVLTLMGEARSARDAEVAMNALMGAVIQVDAWDLGQHEVKAPVAPDFYYAFKLTAVARGK